MRSGETSPPITTNSAYERYAHERVGRAIGMTDDELSALADGLFSSSDLVEESAYRLCQLLNHGQASLTDDEFAGLREVLGEEAIIDLVILVSRGLLHDPGVSSSRLRCRRRWRVMTSICMHRTGPFGVVPGGRRDLVGV